MKHIFSAIVLFLALACSREDSREGSGSTLFGNGETLVQNICNKETVALYLAVRAEIGSQMYTDGWQVVNPGACISINVWDRYQGIKSYYIQSQYGRYTPVGAFYNDVNGSSDSRATLICLPRNIVLGQNFSEVYNGTQAYTSGACPNDRIRYQTTDLGYGDSGFQGDTMVITYTLARGSFQSSERLISKTEGPLPPSLNDKIAELTDRVRTLEGNVKACDTRVGAILSNGKILGTAISKLDELKDRCEFGEDEYKDLRKKFQETKNLAKESISVLVAFLKGFYEKLSTIGSSIGVSAPYEDDYNAAGVGQLIRPAIDSELASNAQGFFSRNADRYKEMLVGYYGQYTDKFIASALALTSTYASFGAELGAQDEMDQDKVVDYLKSVNSIEEYFGTIDFDKGEYGYPTDSPVPNDIRKTVAEDIKPNAGSAGVNLEDELKKWRGIATPQQVLLLEAIRYLGISFHQAVLNAPGVLKEEFEAIKARLTVITEGAVKVVRDGAICAAKVVAADNFGDWYEIINKRDICTGEEITRSGQVISAAGLVIGSAKFWRVMGETVGIAVTTKRVFKETEVVVDSAKRWDNIDSLVHIVKGEYKVATDGTTQLISGMHTKLGFDNFLKLNQNAGKTYSIRNVTEFTSERIEAGGEILSQTLENGVRRVQLPRDAWANGDAVNSAIAFSESGQRLKGVKSLFPESWDVAKITEATNTIVSSPSSVISDRSIEGIYDGVKMKVFIEANGKVATSFPSWRQ